LYGSYSNNEDKALEEFVEDFKNNKRIYTCYLERDDNVRGGFTFHFDNPAKIALSENLMKFFQEKLELNGLLGERLEKIEDVKLYSGTGDEDFDTEQCRKLKFLPPAYYEKTSHRNLYSIDVLFGCTDLFKKLFIEPYLKIPEDQRNQSDHTDNNTFWKTWQCMEECFNQRKKYSPKSVTPLELQKREGILNNITLIFDDMAIYEMAWMSHYVARRLEKRFYYFIEEVAKCCPL